jgi:hypothetical protein
MSQKKKRGYIALYIGALFLKFRGQWAGSISTKFRDIPFRESASIGFENPR